MKPPGKGKISSEQSIHIYLRISRNLEDEIFPKGVGVVTPKFLFGFFKRFYLTWGEWLNFSSRELSLSYIFLWQKFYLDSPKICLWPWRFLLLFWTQDKMIFIWENNFWKSFWILHYGFWKVLCHFQQFLLAMALVQILSPNPPLIFGSCLASNPASWTSPMLIFPFKSYSNKFLPSILSIGDLQRNSTFCFDFCPQTNSPP